MRRRAVAQFAVVVIAPTLNPIHRTHGTGVPLASGDSSHIATQPHHVHRDGPITTRCAIPYLTVAVVPPALDATRCTQSAGVLRAGCEGGHVAIQPYHSHWGSPIRYAVVT